jgi:hypothetical protein
MTANTKQKIKKAKTKLPSVIVEAFKGFDQKLQCRGFQFEIGKSYTVNGKIEVCKSGFHACEIPFDVWGYYGPGNSRFAVVEQGGEIARHSSESKIASAEITIKAELMLPDFIKRGVQYVLDHVDWKNDKESNTGDRSAATNTGNRSAATNTGDRSAATNTGYQSAATNTGDRSAATNTGYQSAATNTGYQSAATNTGKEAVAMASGYEGRVSGANGCALFLVERDNEYKIIAAWAGIVGRDGIKPDVLYMLKDGKPTECAVEATEV